MWMHLLSKLLTVDALNSSNVHWCFTFKFSDFGGFLVLRQSCYKSGVTNVIYDLFLHGW